MAASDETGLVVSGATIVTMDRDRRVIDDGAVAVRDGTIVAVGGAADIAREHAELPVIDATDCVVTPGLVDAHNHPIHYLSKGLADDRELSDRSYRRIWPYEAALTDDEAHLSALCTFAEMLRNGTTCFCDPGGYRADAVGRAALEIGIRGIVARESWDVPDPNAPGTHPESTDDALERGVEVVERWHGAGDGRLRAWLSLVRPAHVTDELCVRTLDRAEELGVGVHGHLIVSRTTDEATRRVVGHGSALRRYHDLGVLRPSLCLAHLGWVEPEEIDLLLAADLKAVHCPSASMLGGFGVIAHGTLPEMVAAGLTVGLGTDAGAISRFLDLVRVAYLAATAHKDARIDPTVMGAHKAFAMATIDGARALLWDDRIGSLEPGKAADLVIFDADDVEWHPNPLRDPVANLVYSASGRSARTVLVDGRPVMRDRELTQVDLRALLAEADAAADAVRSRLP